jgi:hypothetical protein
VTDLRHDGPELTDPPTAALRSAGGLNPYAAPGERVTEPVLSDPYAALREDAEAREANEFALPTISSLSSLRPSTADAERILPPEPVLSEAVLVAAGLLEREADDAPAQEPDLTAVSVAPVATKDEVTFSDFLHEDRAPVEEETDVTEIFADLEPVEVPAGLWRRGDDDVIGAATTSSRSAKRPFPSLRLRRRAA